MSGTNQGGRAIAFDVDLRPVAVAALERAQQVLGVQDADDVLGRSAPQRHARDRRGEHGLDDLLGRIVGADRDHLGAVDHHVGDGEIAQVEQAAEHVAVVLLDAALVVQQIDRRRAAPRAPTGSAWSSPTRKPNRRRIQRTSASIADQHGPSSRTTHEIGRATSSATRSGALIATVFGSTSPKTTTSTVMTTVA